MSRKYNIAGIYMITQYSTNKIYIGETQDIQSRWSAYRSLHTRYIRDLYKKPFERYRAIEQEIIKNGIEDFKFDVVVDQFDNNELIDTKYRRTLEAYYIDKYHANDPKIGYNTYSRNSYIIDKALRHSYAGQKTKPGTKILKSDPIIVYDIDDESTMMFLGKKSFGDHINKDKGIIARCTKTGKRTSHYLIYALDPTKRAENAERAVKAKLVPNMLSMHGTDLARRYIKGLEAVNDWCKLWGYDTIDTKYYYSLISAKEK